MNKIHSQPVRRLKKRMTGQNVELQSHMCQAHIEGAVSKPILSLWNCICCHLYSFLPFY